MAGSTLHLESVLHRYESPVRFSQSLLWSLQARAYGRGMDAWSSGAVPSYASSNAFLARRYAYVVEGFARDMLRRAAAPRHRGARPLTIVEIGAGSGSLAFYIVRSLAQLWSDAAGAGALPPFRYILTDFSGRHIEAWRSSGAFSSHIRAGQVDFARFDADLPDVLNLEESGEQISPDAPAGDMVVIANYVLDTLRQDHFRVEDGALFEGRVAMASEYEGELSDPGMMSRIKLHHEFAPAELPYYDDPPLDALLQRYCRRLRRSAFLLPVTFLNALRHLQRLAGGTMLALVGDRGQRALSELEGQPPPAPVVKGEYFSFPGNLDAVAAFAGSQGGGAMFAEELDDLFQTGGFTFGCRPARLPETARAFQRAFGDASPRDLYGLFQNIGAAGRRLAPEAALFALRVSSYDPRTMLRLAPSIEDTPPDAPEKLRTSLVAALDRVQDNYYPLGLVTDVSYRLGRLFQRLGEPERAIACYEQSNAGAATRYMRYYRIAQCQMSLGNLREARRCLVLCLEENPDFDRALDLQSRLDRV